MIALFRQLARMTRWIVCVAVPLMSDRGLGAAESAVGAPQRGGILRMWRPDDWRSLDPAIAFDADAAPVQKLLFRGLLNYGPGNDLVLDQAESWEVSPDGRVYTFRLKPGVRFGHGREVEAGDYVYSIRRILDSKTGSAGQGYFADVLGAAEFMAGKASQVAGLRARDRRTLEIELVRPVFTFRYVMAMNFASALPRDVVTADPAGFKYRMVGSGPYRVRKWRRAVGWWLERNPEYRGADGWIDGVEISFGGDAGMAAMRAERGELDWFVADLVVANRFSRDPSLKPWLHWVDTVSDQYLAMNTEVKPFDDVRVRRAVNHAVDKQRLARLVGGRYSVAQGIVPPSMPWTNPDCPVYEFDPAKARRLLGEAGVPEGTRVPIAYIESRPIDKRVVQNIQQDLAAVGLVVELRGMSYPAFEVRARTRRSEAMAVWGWVQDYPDPSTFLDTLFNGALITDTDCNNIAFYRHGGVDRLLREAAGTSEIAARLRLYREVERQVMTDAPWVPLFHERYALIQHPRVRGFAPHPVWLWRLDQIWIRP